MINWRNIKFRSIANIALATAVMFGVVRCVNHFNEVEQQRYDIRNANGGIVPGEEAIDNKGKRYTFRTILHNGNEYTCFYRNGMACVKE